MSTVAISNNNLNHTICIPKDMEFPGVSELEIRKERDTLFLRPIRPSWLSLVNEVPAAPDFLRERLDVIDNEPFVAVNDDASTEATGQ